MNKFTSIYRQILTTTCLSILSVSILYAQDASGERAEPQSAVQLVASPDADAPVGAPEDLDSPALVDLEQDPVNVDPSFVDAEGAGASELVNVTEQEVPASIETVTGIGDFDYDTLIGGEGEWSADAFIDPVVTKPTANALLKDEGITPDVYWAIKDYLTQEDFPLSAEDKSAILNVYFERQGELIFVTDEARQAAFEVAKQDVEKQGLPKSRYEFALPTSLDPVQSFALSEIDAAAFTIKYGRDMERGIVAPNSLGSQFDLVPEGRAENALLADFANSEVPKLFYDALEPNDPDYATLKAELAKYEELYLAADVENIPSVPDAVTLKIGSKGEAVAILRKRLSALGFDAEYSAPEPVVENGIDNTIDTNVVMLIAQELTEDVSATNLVYTEEVPQPVEDVFDPELAEALRLYQAQAGLGADGIAGPRTLATINEGPRAQMAPYLIAMERHRWGAEDRTGRQIYVNLANFMTEVRDDNVKTFETRVVIGKNDPKYKTPEFHDEMEYLVINPEWNVPHSIGTREMLPRLQRGRGLGSTYKMLNSRGQRVNPANVNFNKYTARTFPYRFVQESGPSNALGKVKFIFPNVHNIYLHDTPAKSLFSHNNRAYSHGCVRVADPIDLATHLMAPYYDNPRASFDQIRSTKKQRFVEMTTRIPVFLTYFTTYVDDEGNVHRVRDIYGRDQLVKNALAEQGVVF